MTTEKPQILNDYIFKKIFSKKGNESILKDFLIGILEIPIKKANDEYEYLTGDEAERRLAFLREKAIRDEINNLNGSRSEGIEIGKKEGLKEGIKEEIQKGEKRKQIEIAKNMLKKGMDAKLISELTNLSVQEIKK